jgi:hypothetical protein
MNLKFSDEWQPWWDQTWSDTKQKWHDETPFMNMGALKDYRKENDLYSDDGALVDYRNANDLWNLKFSDEWQPWWDQTWSDTKQKWHDETPFLNAK